MKSNNFFNWFKLENAYTKKGASTNNYKEKISKIYGQIKRLFDETKTDENTEGRDAKRQRNAGRTDKTNDQST